jgi:hypothetical protein
MQPPERPKAVSDAGTMTPGALTTSFPIDRLRPLRRRVVLAWACGLLSAGLLMIQTLLWVIHPWWLVFVILLVGTFVGSVGAMLRGLVRLLRGPRRRHTAVLMALGMLPAAFWISLGVLTHSRWQQRNIRRDWPFLLTVRAAQCLMEAQAAVVYPRRIESERLVMYFDGRITDPERDLEAMDRHVADLEKMLGVKLAAKIHWVRGSLLGQRYLCCLGIALGTEQSPASRLDRHELAHAVMGHCESAWSDPPTVLEEGWAEAQSWNRFELDRMALGVRNVVQQWMATPKSERGAFLKTLVDPVGFDRLFRNFEKDANASYVEALTDEYWYHRDKGPVYAVGGALVDYLIRKYGAPAYLEFHLGSRPGAVEAECRHVFGVGVREVEAGFWRDVAGRK